MEEPPDRQTSKLSAELIGYYLATVYKVDSGKGQICFSIDVVNPALDELLHEHAVTTAAFLTASNPYSEPNPPEQNAKANKGLEAALRARQIALVPGAGSDPAGEWPPEHSYLALGISRNAADSIAQQFRQNAYVWLSLSAPPQLILLR